MCKMQYKYPEYTEYIILRSLFLFLNEYSESYTSTMLFTASVQEKNRNTKIRQRSGNLK